jgi:5S rRNA maturation endonuclease (ribonuclease M5)
MVLCMRIQSERSKTLRGGETGWLHPLGDAKPFVRENRAVEPPSINVRKVLREWFLSTDHSHITELAERLVVDPAALTALECQLAPGYASMTWGFPMKDGYGNYIGIRLRNAEGRKWAVTGSRAGIFIPKIPPRRRMMITEGPTDTAAGISLGLYTVGRPSCSGGSTHLIDHVKRARVAEVVIVADNDDPGIRGAQELQHWLPVPSCILMLPCKDLREFLALRIGDKSTIDSMIDQLVWTQPKELC